MDSSHNPPPATPHDAVSITDVVDYALKQFAKEFSAYHAAYDAKDTHAMLRAEKVMLIVVDRLDSFRLRCFLEWSQLPQANPTHGDTTK